MDKAQKYTDKAIAQIDKLKNSPGEKNKTILVNWEVFLLHDNYLVESESIIPYF